MANNSFKMIKDGGCSFMCLASSFCSKTVKLVPFFWGVCCFIGFILIEDVRAIGITHLVKPNSNFHTISTASACSLNKTLRFPANCNPALFKTSDQSGLLLSVHGKASGSSVDNGKKLIFEPISRDLLEFIFEHDNLLSFTANTDINFLTKYFSFDYSPYYLIADAYVNNPSFPEVALFLVKQRTLRLTSGMELPTNIEFVKVSLGSSLFYYSRKISNQNILLAQVATDQENIVQFDKESGIDADFGLILDFANPFLPSVSFQSKNTFSQYTVNESRMESVRSLEPFLLLEAYTQLGIGLPLKTPIGSFALQLETFYDGFFKYYYVDYLTLSASYTLGLLSATLTGSQNFKTIGLYFTSSVANTGLVFAQEKEIAGSAVGDQLEDRSVYLSMEFAL